MNIRKIALATVVAGSLDILSAALLTASKGRSIIGMLQSVGSGPFGNRVLKWDLAGAMVGLATHFALMLIMVVVFAKGIEIARVSSKAFITGPLYGTAIYLVMYWIVLPLRWPPSHAATSLGAILVPLAIHILLVGLPIAAIVRPKS